MNILVVDDNATNRKFLLVTLGAEGFTVFEAADGVEALAILEREKIDAIISDILMPRMDGYRLCYEVRRNERFHNILFIIFTCTYTSPSDEKFSLELGADKFVRKPAPTGEMLRLLRDLSPRPHAVLHAPIPELAVLKEYSERLVAKLEDKNVDLMRATDELRLERDFNVRLLDDFPTPVWRSDVDGNGTYFNRTWLEFTGRTQDEELGHGWSQGVHADDLRRVMDEFLQAARDCLPFEREYRLRRSDGEYRNIVDHGKPYEGTDGNLAGYIGYCYDISDRKQAEANLRASEIRYRRLFEAARDGILILNAETGMIEDVNPFLIELMGFTKEQFLCKKVWELGHLRHMPANREKFTELQRDKYVRYEDLPLETSDGRTIDVEFVSNVYPMNGGMVIQCNIRNITERKCAQESLKVFRALIDQSSEIIEVIDPKTARFLDVNERGCTDLGYGRDEFLSLKVFDVDPMMKETTFPKIMDQLRHLDAMVWNGLHRRKDGSTFPVEVRIKYVRLDHDYVVAVARNITEHQQTEEALRNSAEQLRALGSRLQTAREDESLRLARAIHDDLGHPLTRLVMEVTFLEEALAKTPLPRAEILKHTGMMSKQVADTVRAVQRIATELRPSLLDDLGLAAALEWQLEQFATRTGIRCRWLKKSAGREPAYENAIVVFRIFQEILNNVCRHSGATSAEICFTAKSGKLTLSVRDDGKGFDEKALPPRAALGLLGMREYTILIGGQLEIESALGRGTTVTLSALLIPMPREMVKTAKISRRKKV